MGLRNFVGTVALLLLGVQVKNVASSSSPWIGQVNDLSSANFDSALAARDVPLWFLDFYAPWCGHCKRLAPVLDEIVLETDKMAVGKIDAVQNRRVRWTRSGYLLLGWKLTRQSFLSSLFIFIL